MKIRISCIISLSLSGLFGKDNFSITEFSLPSEISTVFIEDWNGNGRRDILVLTDSLWYIYFQSHDGWKTKNADLVFPPPQAAIVYDFGNVDDEPDNELVYFSSAGVFKVKIGSPNSEPILLFKTKTLFDQFHDSLSKKEDGFSGKRFTFLMEFKKGKTDIVVPTLEGFEIWERNETFQFSHKLGGVGSREIKSYNAVGISGVYTINNYRLIDVNKDGEKEFMFNNDDHFSIYLKNPSTQSPERLDIPFPETLLKKNKKEKPATITKLDDINNDGVVDIVARKIATQSLFSFRTHIQTYFGAMDTSQFPPILTYFDSPGHVAVVEGISFPSYHLDFNLDGKPEMVVSYVELSLMQIIKALVTKTVNFNLDVYSIDKSGLYGKTPEKQIAFSMFFSLASSEGSTTSSSMLNMNADFNGDDINDLIVMSDDDELTIILGDEKDYFDYDHSIEFESDILKKHFKYEFEDLNSDKKTDLIMIFPEERQIMLLESDIE